MPNVLTLSQKRTMTTIQEAVNHLIDQNRLVWAKNTQRTYRNALRRFCTYLEKVEGIQLDASPTLLGQDLAIPKRYAVYLVERAKVGATAASLDSNAKSKGRPRFSVSTYALYLTAVGLLYEHLFRIDGLGRVTVEEFQRAMSTLSRLRDVDLDSTDLKEEGVRTAPCDEIADRLIALAAGEVPADDLGELRLRRAELRRLRNMALLETLRSTGARLSEVLALNRGDIMTNHTAVLHRKTTKGKSRRREIHFSPRAWKALRTYMRESDATSRTHPVFLRHGRCIRDEDGTPLRFNAGGAQAEIRRLRDKLVEELQSEIVSLLLPHPTEDDVHRLVAAFDAASEETGGLPAELYAVMQREPTLRDEVLYLKELIVEAQQITAHSFRHGVITRIIEKTGDLSAAQLIAGHADVRTTQGYIHLGDEHLREIHHKVFD
jgi:site-specific recombinase XerD